jgi:hypothetical protein
MATKLRFHLACFPVGDIRAGLLQRPITFIFAFSTDPGSEHGTAQMAELYPSIAQCAVAATAFKLLLFPA